MSSDYDDAPAGPHPPANAARGTLYVVSAPSGAGKTSLVNALTTRDRHIEVSVSHTTRAARPGERDGVNYHFVAPATFEAMLAQGGFLEHARVFDHWYGTSAAWVQSRLDDGADVLLEIDWQGARQVRNRLRCTTIFIVPPSRAALLARLRQRGQDDEAVIARRTAEAREELSHYDEYDYLVINDDFEVAAQQLCTIVAAERLRAARQAEAHRALFRELLD
jgi:guanylate kinase